MPTNGKSWIALSLQVLMGAWFVYAGGLKIFSSGLERFAVDVGNYKLLSKELTMLAAYCVPWVEVMAGLCFMLGILKKGAWLAILGLVLVFTLSIASAWARGLDISCGCLGGKEKISYWTKAVEFTIYYLILAFLASQYWSKKTGNTDSL